MDVLNQQPQQYRKTVLTSPKGLVIAKELKDKDGVYHLFGKQSTSVVFLYNVDTNRMMYMGGAWQLSPQFIEDCAALCDGIFDNS